MPLYRYRCSAAGHEYEALEPMSVVAQSCRECGGSNVAVRVPFNAIAPVRTIESVTITGRQIAESVNGRVDMDSPQTRQKFALFQEATQTIDHAYAKAERELGHPIQGPNLWNQAKASAQQIQMAGQAPLPAKKG